MNDQSFTKITSHSDEWFNRQTFHVCKFLYQIKTVANKFWIVSGLHLNFKVLWTCLRHGVISVSHHAEKNNLEIVRCGFCWNRMYFIIPSHAKEFLCFNQSTHMIVNNISNYIMWFRNIKFSVWTIIIAIIMDANEMCVYIHRLVEIVLKIRQIIWNTIIKYYEFEIRQTVYK